MRTHGSEPIELLPLASHRVGGEPALDAVAEIGDNTELVGPCPDESSRIVVGASGGFAGVRPERGRFQASCLGYT